MVHSSVLIFNSSVVIFHCGSVVFSDSLVVIFDSPVVIFDSPVVIFDGSVVFFSIALQLCIVGGVLSDELRGRLLRKPDLTQQTAHNYCRTFEAAELQKYKSNKPTVAGIKRSLHSLRKVMVQEKTSRYCAFCGYKHPFTQPPRCPEMQQV